MTQRPAAEAALPQSADEHPAGVATARRPRERHVSDFTELAVKIRTAGLLRRRYVYYAVRISAMVAAFVGTCAFSLVLGNSWYQLIVAAVLAIVVTQFGFLGHDAAHRQIFASPRWNGWTARIMSGAFAGLSYAWWTAKHSRHHRAPNQQDRDPDIGNGVVLLDPQYALGPRMAGFSGWFTRHQGYLFPFLLLFEGVNLHVAGVVQLVRDRQVAHRRLELSIIMIRLFGLMAALAVTLPPGKALAFLGVHLGVFGLLLGGSFAPNHKGMPIVPRDSRIDFLRRQVLVSRNIRGGVVTDFMMGGLNYQIEHHLFPSMPSANLRFAQPIVEDFCRTHGVAYTNTTLLSSYAIVIRYLNQVGLRDRDPFACPLAQQLRT